MNPQARFGIAVLALALSLAGCTATKSDPPAAATPTGSGNSANPQASYRYQAMGLDLCSVDLKVLADLHLVLRKPSKTPPTSGPGEACLYEGTSATGQPASVRLEAVVLSAVDQAKLLYLAQSQTTRMRVVGPVAGLGDEAEGLSLETEPGFKYSEYRVHARRSNVVIEVWVAIGGSDFIPKQLLGAKSQDLAAAVLNKATEAWKP